VLSASPVSLSSSAKVGRRDGNGARGWTRNCGRHPVSVQVIANARTQADGYFTVHVPAGPSRLIDVTYRTYTASPSYAAQTKIEENVNAGVQLHVTPHRIGTEGTITLTGIVQGPIPQQGAIVDLLCVLSWTLGAIPHAAHKHPRILPRFLPIPRRARTIPIPSRCPGRAGWLSLCQWLQRYRGYLDEIIPIASDVNDQSPPAFSISFATEVACDIVVVNID
jgi:hypothetical protein